MYLAALRVMSHVTLTISGNHITKREAGVSYSSPFFTLKYHQRLHLHMRNQVRKNSNGRVYAMKVINKAKIADSKTDVRHTRTERDVLVRVDHPFLIKLHYAFETAERLYLVQEFCRGGELFR